MYGHDSLGRLTSISDSSGLTEWIYDQGENAIGCLSKSISPAAANSNDNIRQRGAVNIVYDRAHAPTPNKDRGTQQLRIPDIPGGCQAFRYTLFGLPSSITTGQTETLFEYTDDEERVVRRDPDKTRYSLGGLYEHHIDNGDGDTLEQRFRIYAGSRPIAEIVRTPLD